jgi:hypothetical protein
MWIQVQTKEQVTEQVLEAVEEVFDGWFADEPRIDWQNFIDRLEVRYEYDMGSSMDSEAIKAIKKYVKKLKSEQ